MLIEAKAAFTAKNYEKTVRLAEKIVKIFEAKEDWRSFMEAMDSLLDVYFQIANLPSIIQTIDYGLKIHQEKCLNQFTWFHNLYIRKSKYLFKKRKFNEGISCLIEAQQLVERNEIGDSYLIETLTQQANFYLHAHNHAKGKEKLNTVFALLEKGNHEADLWVNFYSKRLMLAYIEGDFLFAKKICEKAYELSSLHEHLVVFKLYFHYRIGSTYGFLGSREEEINSYFQSIKLYEEHYGTELDIQAKVHLGTIYSQLGRRIETLGDFAQAFHYFEKAQILFNQVSTLAQNQIFMNLSDMAGVYAAQKNHIKQIEYCKKAIEFAEKSLKGKNINISGVHRSIAGAYMENSEMEKALVHYEKALAVDLEVSGENNHLTLLNYPFLGHYWTVNNNYSKGLEYYHIALKAFQKMGMYQEIVSDIYSKIAINYQQQAQFKTALKNYQQALTTLLPEYHGTDFYQLPDVEKCVFIPANSFLNLLTGKSQTLYDYALNLKKEKPQKVIKTLKASLATCKLATNYLQLLHKTLKAEDSKLISVEKMIPIYEQALKVLLHLTNESKDESFLIQAFDFHESAKALLLRSSMQENIAKAKASIDSDLLEQEQELKNKIETYLQKIQKEEAKLTLKGAKKNDEKLKKWKQQHFDEMLKHQALIEQLEKEYPAYYQLKYQLQSVSFSDLEASLDEQTIVLSYFIGIEKGYVFALSADDYQVVTLNLPPNFDQQIQDYLNTIRAQNFQAFTEQSHTLYCLLVQPLADLIFDIFDDDLKNLVIIPDGILQYLPFETLICEEVTDLQSSTYHQLDYLLNYGQIQYHYSITLYHQYLQQTKVKRQTDSLQSPTPSSGTKLSNKVDFMGFAPVYTSDKEETQAVMRELAADYNQWGTRSEAIRDGNLTPLPFSEEEVENIGALFHKKGLTGKNFLYDSAIKDDFKTFASQAKYLHIAAHGLSNDQFPKLSGIVFHPESNANDIHDSVLSMGEIYQLQLEADLVVLSSCESGIGKLAKGEGMMGINRGFLYAGAKNVVYTLFKVLDKPSSELCQAFFAEILEGKSYSEALRLAKLKLIQQKDLDPKSWCGFVLLGV